MKQCPKCKCQFDLPGITRCLNGCDGTLVEVKEVKPIRTMTELWRDYRDKIYPGGISGVQNAECHQAFFAGALVALQTVDGIADLPEDEAVKRLAQLKREVLDFHHAQVARMKARN